MANSLISTLYTECPEWLIDKAYSSKALAIYSKGQTYPRLVSNNLNSAISSVALPMLFRIQDDAVATMNALSRNILTMLIMALSLYGSSFVLSGLSDFACLVLQKMIGAGVRILVSIAKEIFVFLLS